MHGQMSENKQDLNVLTYYYSCSKWYGYSQGVHNLVFDGKASEARLAAEDDAKKHQNSSHCDISLLQKFHMTVQLQEPFPSLVTFPLSAENK